MCTLIVGMGGYTLHHTIYTLDEVGTVIDIANINTDNVVNYICQMAPKINMVRLQGPTEYCLGFKSEIENKLALEYADHNIEIEVI